MTNRMARILGMVLKVYDENFPKGVWRILSMVLKVYGENFPKGVWRILGMVLKVYGENFLKVHEYGVWQNNFCMVLKQSLKVYFFKNKK